MTETIVVAILTASVSFTGAWFAARAVIQKGRADAKTAADALYSQLCKDLMAYAKDLNGQIAANEQRVTALESQSIVDRQRIAFLEADNARLQADLTHAQCQIAEMVGERERLEGRVSELERENADLKAQIEALQRKRAGR
jgi:chromosome segregation ATPase